MISKLYQNKKNMIPIIGVIFFLLIFMICSIYFKEEEEVPLLEAKEEKKEIINETPKIKIDVKGAVKIPGVYELKEESRVLDAIEKSGGFLENADTNTINLSKKLEDEMVIIIYTTEEINALKESEVRTNKVENTCICPKIENNACVQNPVTNYEENPISIEEGPKIISINSASASDFETLPGIGKVKAEAIIAYRDAHGGFTSLEEIKEVKGIGEKTFEEIREYLTL